ncbi:MAG: dihydrodipicolinate synthase family protein [Armatimonadaceae bacterium]
MRIDSIYDKKVLNRRITGMSAMLLPFEADGSIAFKAYRQLLRDTVNAGLTPAVNMDTGYANLISPDDKRAILELTQAELGGHPFIAGVFIEGGTGDVATEYRAGIREVTRYGATPILFQTSRTHGMSPSALAQTYRDGVAETDTAYAFELGRVFAPNGEIWSDDAFVAILEIPAIKGAKHSSLDRLTELRRLALRDRIRPDFKVLTGNDLGIDMVEYGSDYLLGLATFSPETFAKRDAHWEAGSAEYFAVSDALQLLGNIAFRTPVPAYKHSAAWFLYLQGRIPTPLTHPGSPARPDWEPEILRMCAQRCGIELVR